MKFKYDKIKNFAKPYIIAEIGANHNGDMDLAKKMIDIAKECGANCVKFQSWSKESIFSKEVYKNNCFLKDDYRNRTDYSLEKIVEKYSLGRKEHILLKEYCDNISIDFASTGFSKEEIDFLVDELDVPFLKIASMDLNNLPFIEYISRKSRPILLSTGLSNLAEINEAVDHIQLSGNQELVLLHCRSIYPPANEQVNLNNIDMLRDNFNYPIGYSDHTIGTVAPILSIAKGACVIEKHFTLDKNMEGWDHKVSADPKELQEIVQGVNNAYQMLGSYQRIVNEDKERLEAFRRSIVSAKDIKKGEIITIEDIDFKRPGRGIEPKYYKFIIGKEAKRDIERDTLIFMEDF